MEQFASSSPAGPVQMCPSNPTDRPDCNAECSLLIVNDSCQHLKSPADDTKLQKCNMCRQGCCQQDGVSAHSLVAQYMRR